MSLTINRRLVVAPQVEPVTGFDLQIHATIEETEQDQLNYVEALIKRARARFEQNTSRLLVAQEWEVSLSGFVSEIPLPLAPVTAVLAVDYYNQSGQNITLDSADYRLVYGGLHARLCPAFGKHWPVAIFAPDAVRIRLRCGHAAVVDGLIDESSILDPGKYEMAKQAIMILAADWYNNREDTAPVQLYRAPNAYQSLCSELSVDIL